MDTTVKAVLCIALVFAVSQAIKLTWPGVWDRFHIWLVFALGVGVVFLVGASVWAHSEIINGYALDDMNVASKIVGGLMIGAGAAFGTFALNRVADIGQERVKRPTVRPTGGGRPVAGTGLTGDTGAVTSPFADFEPPELPTLGERDA